MQVGTTKACDGQSHDRYHDLTHWATVEPHKAVGLGVNLDYVLDQAIE